MPSSRRPRVARRREPASSQLSYATTGLPPIQASCRSGWAQTLTGRYVFIAVAAALLPATSPVRLAAGEQTAGDGAAVSIQNELLRVSVDRQDGRLLALEDLLAKHNHVGDGKSAGGLWQLELSRDGRKTVLQPEQAAAFRCETASPDQNRLRLTWEDFSSLDAAGLRVEVVAELEGGEPVSRWGISVDKPAAVGLEEIRFPRLCALRRQAEERLAVPAWMGQQLADPRKTLGGTEGRGRRLAWDYPGVLSLQCLAYYQNGGCGLSTSCDDAAASRKTFAFWGTAGGDVHHEVIHYPAGTAGEAPRYALPYRVSLGVFRGDWITAAERYRAWAIRQPWALESRLRRGLVPAWVLETGLWQWNRGASPGVLPPAAALQARLGLPVRVFWHWWHGCPYDIGFPEYLPPREGTEAFRRAVAKAHDDGLRMLVYMNQRAWGLSTKSWADEGAERFAVKAQDGKIRPEVYNIFTGKALVSMCLATPFWRNKYAGLAEEAFRDLGVDGIYMDQACSQKPCFDPDHGHPLGGGSSWIEGFRALSEDIRNRCRGERAIVLSGEGCGEAWLPYLDLMLALEVSRERYSSAENPWEVIPFFHAVYHPYAVIYGNYSSLVMPPYDELWPAEFAPAEPLALLDQKFSRQFYLEQARTFVWGQQPTLANFRPALLEQRAEEIDYIARLARVRSRSIKYLLHGEFLRPPELSAPQATADFSRLSIYAGQKSRLTSSRKSIPLALAGAWRAADGDVALALASLADETLSLSFTIDRQYYGLPQQPRVHRIDERGREPIELPIGEDGRLELKLPPREAWMIEFSNRL